MFQLCPELEEVPKYDFTNVKSVYCLFSGCKKLKAIPNFITTNVTNMQRMVYSCESITEFPLLDTINVTDMQYMFHGCIRLTSIPQLNTAKVKNMSWMFQNCSSLIEIPELDGSSATAVSYMFNNCTALTALGGIKDVGKAFIGTSSNNGNYKLDLSTCPNLTHDSLMNIINKLYDLNLTYNVANGGTLYTQSLYIGSTNKSKLTAEEIALATAKRMDC